MKRKILLLMMTALLSVGAWATDDVTLTFSDIVLGWNGGGGTKDAETNTLTVVVNEWSGWKFEFGRPVSTTEFSGISINCGEVSGMKLVIFYDSDQNWSKFQEITDFTDVSNIDFNNTGTIASIVFGPTGDATGSIVINSVTLKGKSGGLEPVPTGNLMLPFNKMDGVKSWKWNVSHDDENQTVTIGQWSGSGWTFSLPLSTNVYKGIDFTLTQIPETGGKITIKYTEGENQEISLSSTSVNVDFNRSGYISTIEFAGDGYHDSNNAEDQPLGDLTYGIGDCYVVAKPITATVTDAKYATFAVGAAIDYSTTAPSGLKAYIAYVEAGVVKLNEVSKVPANTAVVLYADVEDVTSYTLSTTTEATDEITGNQLLVSDGTVTGNESTIYVLANGTSGVGFYLLQSGDKVPAGKAYLSVSTVGVRQFIGFGDGNETTGIDNLTPTLSKGEGVYFDLQGRRVAQPTKGLYIVNGKKVVVK